MSAAVDPEGGPEAAEPDDGRSIRWYRALIQNSADMVLVVDAAGRGFYASPSAQRLLGYDVGDWAGRDTWDAVHPDDRAQVGAAFVEVLEKSSLAIPVQFRLLRADGGYMDVEAVASNQLDDDSVGGIVVNLRDIGERVRAETEARRADERYRTLVAALVYGVILADEHGDIVLCNEALEDMFGVPPRRLVGRTLSDVLSSVGSTGVRVLSEDGKPVPEEDHPLLVSLRTGEPCTGVIHAIERPGHPTVWLRINSRPIRGEAGADPVGVAASFADITETKRASADLELALATIERERTFLQVLLDNLEEGIVACDADGRLTLLNPASRRFHGIPDDIDPIGLTPKATGLRQPDGTAMSQAENPLMRALSGEEIRDVELLVENRQGERRVVVANAQALHDQTGAKLGAVVAMHDVSEQKRTEERLAELALHDPLTGVANRLLLDDRLRIALDRIRRAGGGVGVFLLDLDDFKNVNDRHGHDVGDDVLMAVARRLLATIRPEDTVARLGGDEFVVICEVTGGQAEVERIGSRITEALAEPYRLDGHTLVVAASVGGVLAEDAGSEPSKLLSRADDEMYRVKAHRRSARHAGRARGGVDDAG